jgi:hypothetical protein
VDLEVVDASRAAGVPEWGLGSMVAMTGIILGAFKLLSR